MSDLERPLTDRGWRTTTCGSCDGSGKNRWASEFRSDECRFCCGSGRVWVSAKGRVFSYPGGPIIDRLSGDDLSTFLAKQETAP